MRVAVGSDHRGLELKNAIRDIIERAGHDCDDFGCHNSSSVDYPDYAEKVARAVVGGKYQRGILVCGTGIGMSIAANKVRGARAALCHNIFTSRRARQHNDANILCLGRDVIGEQLAQEMVQEFLSTGFEGDRHKQRIDKMIVIENSESRISE